MKLTDEELNKILMKADDDYDRMKDRLHELYEENENLKKANKILEENWLNYMKINQAAVDTLKSIYMLDNVTITNNACEKIDKAINILQNGSEE